MSDPTTSNILLAVPTRGSDPGTWDLPVNSNSAAIDGYFGGVQSISISNVPLTLTAPAGTVTASGGPTQSQNAVIKFTGALTAHVLVTLPLPGFYIIDNQTTGNFVLTLGALGSGQVIGIDQGKVQHIYNDATNVKFVNLPHEIGETFIWGGLNAMPAWVTACTVPPYLICNGNVYNFSTYPYLGARLLGAFGGNGVTTFGVPDHSGRVALPYDATGARITVGGCGINGQTLGAVNPGGTGQTTTLITANLPPYTPNGTITTTFPASPGGETPYFITPGGTPVGYGGTSTGATAFSMANLNIPSTWSGIAQGGTSTPINNVQPAQVTGLSVIRAA